MPRRLDAASQLRASRVFTSTNLRHDGGHAQEHEGDCRRTNLAAGDVIDSRRHHDDHDPAGGPSHEPPVAAHHDRKGQTDKGQRFGDAQENPERASERGVHLRGDFWRRVKKEYSVCQKDHREEDLERPHDELRDA